MDARGKDCDIERGRDQAHCLERWGMGHTDKPILAYQLLHTKQIKYSSGLIVAYISPSFHRALTSSTHQKVDQVYDKTYISPYGFMVISHHPLITFKIASQLSFQTTDERRRHNNGRKRGDVWLLTCPKPRPTFLTFTSSFLTRQVTSKYRILSAENADELNRFE